MEKSHRLHLEVIENAYLLTRMFDAPVAMVYKAWTDPHQFARWWGPHTFTNAVPEMDLRPGGRYRMKMISPEGDEYPMEGNFEEVVPEKKLVLIMNLEGHPPLWHELYNQARKTPAGTALPLVRTTITFEDVNGKTKLCVEQRLGNNRDRDGFIDLGTADGWAQSFAKMDSLLATLSTEREFVHLRTLNAPRALVWEAWSNVEHVSKWWGPNGFRNTFTRFDLRTGGEWIYTMHGPDGTDYPNWMRFDKVEPLAHIVYTHGAAPEDPNAFQGEIIFTDTDDQKTHVEMRVKLASGELRTGMFEFGVFEGGDQTLGRLNAYLAGM
jgi:uncharacterized protein YndB with AHSA1/START domain